VNYSKMHSQRLEIKKKNTLKLSMKEFKCEFCQIAFSRAVNLKRHIVAVNEGKKEYKCEFCPKTFSYAYNLKHI